MCLTDIVCCTSDRPVTLTRGPAHRESDSDPAYGVAENTGRPSSGSRAAGNSSTCSNSPAPAVTSLQASPSPQHPTPAAQRTPSTSSSSHVTQGSPHVTQGTPHVVFSSDTQRGSSIELQATPLAADSNMAASRQDPSAPGAPGNTGPSSSSNVHFNGTATPDYNTDNPLDYSDNKDKKDKPAMTKTIVLTAHGGLEKMQVQERARRTPSNGEVLLKVNDTLFISQGGFSGDKPTVGPALQKKIYP